MPRQTATAELRAKKLSAVVADGDQILGVVASTGVQQNQNCTPILVPKVPPLSNLFSEVTNIARLTPGQISVIEAHGTGTAVGDPAECDSIRQVLGGSVRSSPLAISSVKGLVGHVECAIPAQASFTTMNPAIRATPADNMIVPTSLLPWDVDFRAALINNYGASGSNASIVITESPLATRHGTDSSVSSKSSSPGLKYPFWLCGLDDQSLGRYAEAWRHDGRRVGVVHIKKLLADVAADSIHNGKEASIACYNGPRSFTIASSEAAIDALGDAVAKMPKTMNTIRVKKLNATNAFY
ncbi:thiolase-like protein [Ustulina deusta]|nr:thiolase-like protein [Ustulina deusta]